MKFRELHSNLKIRIFQLFIGSMVANMVFPFMAIYFADRLGAGWTGILMLVNILLSVTAGVYGGFLTDRWGRKRIRVFTEAVRFLAVLVIMLANSPWWDSTMVTFLMLMVTNTMGGLSFPAAEAMLLDVSTPENRKLIYTIEYWILNVTLVVGSVAGSMLFREHLFELFAAVAGAAALSLILLVFFITESYRPEEHHTETPVEAQTDGETAPQQAPQRQSLVGGYKRVLQDRPFTLFVVASILIFALETVTNNYTRIRMSQELVEPTTWNLWGNLSLSLDGIELYSYVTAENALLVVLFGIFIGRIFRKVSDRFVLLAGVLLNAIGYAVIGFSNLPWLLFTAMVIATIGELMYVPIKQSMLPELVPQHNRGSYMAVNGLVNIVAQIIGSLSITIGVLVPSLSVGITLGVFGVISVLILGRIQTHLKAKAAIPQQDTVSG